MKWIQRSIWEIGQSTSLTFLGFIISLLHAANYFYWSSSQTLFGSAVARPLLCWSYLPSCQETMRLPGGALKSAFTIYLVFAAIAGVLFLSRRLTGLAWWLLIYCFVLYVGIYAWEAGFQQNGHAYFIALQFSFFFIPKKNVATSALTLAYFFTDAILKTRPEWLSGVALVDILPVPIKALEWIAAFSVLIQLIMPFFLLSRDGQRMAYGFFSLLILNGFWFWANHEFTPLVLSLVPSFFIFEHFQRARIERDSFYRSFEHPEPSNFWWPALLTLFVVSQFNFSQHVFPAPLLRVDKPRFSESCRLLVFEKSGITIKKMTASMGAQVHPGLQCEAQLNKNLLKSICESNLTNADFKGITAMFVTKGLSDSEYKTEFSIANVCTNAEGT